MSSTSSVVAFSTRLRRPGNRGLWCLPGLSEPWRSVLYSSGRGKRAMASVEEVLDIEGHPCVVVDRVEMRFQVPSTESPTAEVPKRGMIRRLKSKPNMVTVRALNEL